MAAVFLFGNLRASLTLARTLARAGHGVHAGYDDLDPFLVRSNAVTGVVGHPAPDSDPEGALRQVTAYLEQHPEIEALIPVSEVAMRLVSRNRERFPPGVRLMVTDDRIVEACSDKAGLFDLCDRLGVPLARRRMAADMAALLDAVDEIGLPCIVKPVESTEFVWGRKAVVLRTPTEAAEWLVGWPEGHRTLCVQALVEGPRHNVYFGAANGRLLGAVEVEVLRTDRLDGVGYATEGRSVAPLPAVRAATEALVKALDYHGVGCVQVMVDARSGEMSFLEINPRLGGNYKIAESCGMPLSLWLFDIAQGRTPEPKADPWAYPVNRGYIHTKGDLGGLKAELGKGALTPLQALLWGLRAARGALRPDHLTFALSDPWPAVWLYLHKPLIRLGVDPVPRRRGRPAAELALPATGAI